MRYPRDHKRRTREAIVAAACRCFKEHGAAGVSVVDVMAKAGLTHGGFYSHFKSKEELFAEVVRHSLEESRRYLEAWARGARDGEDPLEVIVKSYLSRGHRDHPEAGCPLPTLGSEIGRSGPRAKQVLTDKLREIIQLLAALQPGAQSRDAASRAVGLVSAIVGAMMLARATHDPEYSERILDDCKNFLIAALPTHKPPPPRKRQPSRRRVRSSSINKPH